MNLLVAILFLAAIAFFVMAFTIRDGGGLVFGSFGCVVLALFLHNMIPVDTSESPISHRQVTTVKNSEAVHFVWKDMHIKSKSSWWYANVEDSTAWDLIKVRRFANDGEELSPMIKLEKTP
jgi:hypothetical protein